MARRIACDEKARLRADVKICSDGWSDKWSNTLVYDVETASGRVNLELTIDAAKKLRAMPEQLSQRRSAQPCRFGQYRGSVAVRK